MVVRLTAVHGFLTFEEVDMFCFLPVGQSVEFGELFDALIRTAVTVRELKDPLKCLFTFL